VKEKYWSRSAPALPASSCLGKIRRICANCRTTRATKEREYRSASPHAWLGAKLLEVDKNIAKVGNALHFLRLHVEEAVLAAMAVNPVVASIS
jgi:hypothetical protein